MHRAANHAGRSSRRVAVLIASVAVMASLALVVATSSLATSMPVTLSSHTTLVQPAEGAGFKFFDAATLSASGEQPTGTMTFRAFGPILWPFAYSSTACSGTPADESTEPVIEGDATSQIFTPPPGDEKLYLYTVSYSGDAHYEPATSKCGADNESVLVPLVSFAMPGQPEVSPTPSTMPRGPEQPVRVASLRFSPSRLALGHGRSLVLFSLSAAAPIEIRFARKLAGRRTSRGCMPASRPARVPKWQRCIARRTTGVITGAGEPGANRFVFDGHVGSRLLPAGTYVAQVKAAGVSSSNTAELEVVRHGAKSRH
jgi:hypothetical protein